MTALAEPATSELSPIILPDSAQLPRKRWTRDDVRRLLEQGHLDPNKHYELIEGEIVEKMGQGRKHIYIINLLFRMLGAIFGPEFVQSQGMLSVNLYNQPEPDTAVLDKSLAEYLEVEPGPENVRLMVEVSDSTLNTDRSVKGLVYARAGIAEYWIVNVKARKLEVYRQPTPDGYALTQILMDDQTINPLAAPDTVVRVADLLPAVQKEQ